MSSKLSERSTDDPKELFKTAKPIPGYDRYFATVTGEILSIKSGEPKFMVKHPNIGRYWSTGIRPTGAPKTKHESVHTLVCMAFHGPRPHPLDVVAHWDGDPKNNRPDNLRWATRKENAQDMVRHERSQRGHRQVMRVLSEQDVIEIRLWLTMGYSTGRVGRAYGVGSSVPYHIKSGKTWSWLRQPHTKLSLSEFREAEPMHVIETA